MKFEINHAKAQFEFEREHRLRILGSSKGIARKRAFNAAYSGLSEGIQSGRFLNEESEPEQKAEQKFRLLCRFIAPSSVVAELGPGEYFLANIVAAKVRLLTLVDVIDPQNQALSKNCHTTIGDGTLMPKQLRNLNMIWSAHVIEHIHPEALHEHLKSVRDSLVDGGYYVLFTPNRFTGPHDISKYFSPVAQGLHLKEYTVTEARHALLQSKFRKVFCYAGGKGMYYRVPAILPLLLEFILGTFPLALARWCANILPCKALLGIIIVGRK